MRRILLLTAAALFMLSCVGFAKEVPLSDCVLGGISQQMTYNQVVAMYGEPTSKKGKFGNGETAYIKYGDTIQVMFVNGVVWNVLSIGNNGWKLPSGITVGSNIKDIIAMYGEPTSSGKGMFGDYFSWESERNRDGRTYDLIVSTDDVQKKGKDIGKIISLQISYGRIEDMKDM